MKSDVSVQRVLSLAIASVIAMAAADAASALPIVADGTHVDASGQTVAGNPGYLGHAMSAVNGGSITASDMTLSTSGEQASGAIASGVGSRIELSNSTIATSGYVSPGLNATDGGRIAADGVTFSSTGNNGRGVQATGAGSEVTFNGGRITTATIYADGVRAADNGVINLGRDSAGQGTVITSNGGSVGLLAGSSTAGASGAINAVGATVNSNGPAAFAGGAGARLNIRESTINSLSSGVVATLGGQAVVESTTIRAGRADRINSHGVSADNGAHVDVRDTSISTIGARSYGLYATTAGTIDATSTNVATTGLNSHGAVVDSADSRITIAGGQVTTTGQEAYGLYSSAGVINADNLTITTSGLGSIGVFARGSDAVVTLSNSTVVGNNRAHGAAALGGAQLNIISSDLTANDSNGVTARNAGTRVNVVGSNIQTSTQDSHGVLLSDTASATIDGGRISTAGDRSRGIWAAGGSTVNVTNARIETAGNRTADASGLPFGAAGAVASSGAQITLQNTDVATTGYWGDGVDVEGDGSLLRMIGGSVHTTGDDSKGAAAYGGTNQLSLEQVRILTEGQNARGVVASGAGSTADVLGVTITTRGGASHGLDAIDGARVQASGTNVTTQGSGAYAARASNGAQIDLQGGTLFAAASAGLGLEAATLRASDGTRIEGGNGRLAEFASDSANTVSFERNVVALGDIRFSDAAIDSDGNGSLDRTSSLSLNHDSYWKGATDAVGDLSLASGSRWDVTGDSQIGSLTIANATLAFDHADGQYKTVTVDGDFHAENGLLAMNTALGDDTSPTDRLHVRGDTSGTARIAVNNIGGPGALTNDGIQLVQVDGVSAGRYQLQGRAVGGAYEYFLHQGGRTDPTDGDWYLRSQLPVAPIDECLANPQNPACLDPEVPTPVERPEGGVYLANQAAAVGMFDLTMHERVGEPNLAERQKNGDTMGGVWARVTSDHTRGRIDDQLTHQGRQNLLQVGADLTRWGREDRGVVGVMAGTGEATERVLSQVTGYAAEGRVKGRAAGVYGSWLRDAANDGGLYVDSWAQFARFRNTTQGDALQAERYDSRSTTASVDTGYAFNVHRGSASAMYLEPQAQVIWSDYRMDGGRHVETNGTQVREANAGGVRTRVGVRLFGHTTMEGINRVQPFAAVNWLRNHGGANAVWMDDIKLQGAAPRDVYEAKAGVQLQLSRALTAWGEISAGRGAKDYRSYGGLLGVKYAW
ncbi:autotransporter outer membrane beta-barrel domain-containing protein [Stenotrophomonas sp. JAI102]|uniref:autotransporter outer membrane beta-barrel domain-containing protein n=1 Tax=Stenotrophomonas sp. JAI102 TaxID=2723077 RepID=UPI0015CCE1F0|nr:autotransporter outer membrane beta-barrel domain-containing protein [Stenotrophomonas sp. JAI102]NYF34869.1 autotransporter family porin [Stenotrophomonas sp. JAI102]